MAEETFEKEGLGHLARIEEELEEIKDRTANPKRSFINGMWQGAGAIVGSIAAIILLGWGLSVLGLVPGVGDIANSLHRMVDTVRSR
ncbi:MAG: hypothetical protein JWM46_389 [Candidatus Kaiserbacteria bacterium]|nr:hypothetical protein [Candidatus Kaiserbacteria bacterium]